MRTLAPRVLAWLVVFSLIVPRPALALREQATPEKDPKTLAGLEEALKDPDKALRQLTQLVTSPRSHSDPAVPPVVVPATSLTGLEEAPDLSRIMPQIRAGDPGLDPDLLEWVASLGQSISSHAPVVFQELVAGYRRSVPVEELKSEAELGRPPRYFYSLGSFEGSLLKALWEREGQINRALQVYLARRIFTRATELHRRPTFTAKPLKTQIPKEQIPALLESGLIRLVRVEGAKWGLTPVSFVLLPAEGIRVSQIRAQLKKLSGGLPTDRPLGTGLEETQAAGLEEQRQPEKLTWKAWWATLGYWKDLKTALMDLPASDRPTAKARVYRLLNRVGKKRSVEEIGRLLWRDLPHLVKLPAEQRVPAFRLVEAMAGGGRPLFLYDDFSVSLAQLANQLGTKVFRKTVGFSLALILKKSGDPQTGIYQKSFSAAWVSLSGDQDAYQQGLYYAFQLAERGVSPWDALSRGFPSLAKAVADRRLTPKQSLLVQKSGLDLAKRGIDPSDLFIHVAPSLGKLFPEQPGFSSALDSLKQSILLIEKAGLDPAPLIRKGLPGALAKGVGAEQLPAVLDFSVRLAKRKIDPSAAVMGISAPLAGAAPALDHFKSDLQLHEALLARIHRAAGASLPRGLWSAVLAAKDREEYLMNVQTFEGFLLQAVRRGLTLHSPQPVFWEMLDAVGKAARTPAQFAVGLDFFFRLHGQQGFDWVKLDAEKRSELAEEAIRLHGQSGYQLEITPERGHYEGREEYYDDPYQGTSSYTSETYVIDSPQQVRVAPKDKPSSTPMTFVGPTLNHRFLEASRVLELAGKAYALEGKLRQFFDSEMPKEGVVFNREEVGILAGYYPFTALGRELVIRVFPEERARAMTPVGKILLKGQVDSGLRYEVISREEFRAMLEPDRMSDVSLVLLPVPSQSSTLEQLETRNWLWRWLGENPGEASREEVSARIGRLKEQLAAILEGVALLGLQYPVSLYALGGAVWGKSANDLDLVVISKGERPFEMLEVRSVPDVSLPLHVRTVGLATLQQALANEMMENRKRIRVEAVVMQGSGVLLAGQDLFAATRIPAENLRAVADHIRASIQGLDENPLLSPDERDAKRARWSREVEAIERFAAEAGLEESKIPMRFIVDTSKGDTEVLNFARWAALLVRKGARVRFAGVATAWERSQIEEQVPEMADLFEDYIRVYNPGDPESYENALNVAKGLVFGDAAKASPEFIITHADPVMIRWFLSELDRLGISDSTAPGLRREIQSTLTAA